jgi:hypothetical protein
MFQDVYTVLRLYIYKQLFRVNINSILFTSSRLQVQVWPSLPMKLYLYQYNMSLFRPFLVLFIFHFTTLIPSVYLITFQVKSMDVCTCIYV